MSDATIPTETSATTTDPVDAVAVDPLAAATILGGETKPDAVPDTPADPAAPVSTTLGAPEAYEPVLPEGFGDLDKNALAAAEPIFRDLDLSNEAVGKLMPAAKAFAEQVQQRAQAALIDSVVRERAAWAAATIADKEVGGTPERHQEAVQVAARALDQFATPELRKVLHDSGLANHPEMVRFVYRVGMQIGEDSRMFRPGDTSGDPKSTKELLYGTAYDKKDTI